MLKKIVVYFVLYTSFVKTLHLSNNGARLVIYPQNLFLNAFAGSPLDLLCIGETDNGHSFSEFKWLDPRREEIPEGCPGVERVNNNTLLLTFANPTVKDSGNYKCTAIYDGSDYMEAEVSVLFYEDIKFENCPESQVLLNKEDGEITCHVNSSTELSITWIKDNNKLGSGRYIFTSTGIAIENVKKDDAGLYVIEAFEPRTGTTISRSITVDVSDRDAEDAIGIEKLFVSRVTDTTVRFNIHLSGGVWGIDVEYKERLSEREEFASWTQGDVFEVRNLIPSGRYQFRFHPRPSKTTKWFKHLNVTLLPETPKVIFSNNINGNLELEYVWTTDDSRRGTIDRYRLSYQKVQKVPDGFKRLNCITDVDIRTCFGPKYTITGLSAATLYEINVTAHTSAGFGKSSNHLYEVQAPSSIKGSRIKHSEILISSLVLPASTYEAQLLLSPSADRFEVPVKKPLEVTCKGDPNHDQQFTDIKWINPKNESVSDGNPRVEKGDSSLKLLFTEPEKDDSGIYQCIAHYGKDYILKTEVSIYFYDIVPTFDTNYEQLMFEEVSDVEITCSAMGDTPITYTWYDKHEQVIPETYNSSKFASASENGSTLFISSVSREDAGSYVCTAKNIHGLSSKVYDIKVIPSTNNDTENETAIHYIRVSNITANSVQFDISTSDQVTSIEVAYHIEDKGYKEYRTEWRRGDVYIVRELIPAGLYNFRFRAITNTGTDDSIWSETYHVTLLADVPEVIFRKLGANSIEIEWFRNFDEIMRGTIDKFQLMYYVVRRSSGNTWQANDCAVTIELTSCYGSSYTIAGLSQRVYYEIVVRAHTESGYGNPYKQKIFIT